MWFTFHLIFGNVFGKFLFGFVHVWLHKKVFPFSFPKTFFDPPLVKVSILVFYFDFG